MVKKIIMLVVGFTIAMGIAACQEKEQDKDQPSDGANGTVETTQAVESSADVSSTEATDVSSEPMAPQEPEVEVTVDETTDGSQPDVSVQQPAADATDLSAPVVQDATMSVPGAEAPDTTSDAGDSNN